MRNVFLSVLLLCMISCSLPNSNSVDSNAAMLCECLNGIGAVEGDTPVLTYSFSTGQTLSICGFVDSATYCDKTVYSEFDVYMCGDTSSLARYSAMENCYIVGKQDTLVLQYLNFLPVGNEWEWKCFAVAEQLYTASGDRAVYGHCA